MGVRSDIPELMLGMDLFLFPSLNEGLPVVAIEAQARGLPCNVYWSYSRNRYHRKCNLFGFEFR